MEIRKATEKDKLNIGEFLYFKRLITEVYPKGFVSIVSDTWDFWKVMIEYLPKLKDTIMSRDGRVVIRPDSGDPVDIICGVDPNNILTVDGVNYFIYGIGFMGEALIDSIIKDIRNNHNEDFEVLTDAQVKGAYQILWETFGGHTNEKGYKVLDTHIGMIYGDSINLERQNKIYKRLEAKGFAATNLVLGVGSFTYQFKSRDSLGFAMKATWCQVNGEGREIFKDPKTDSGMKKSLKGLITVVLDNVDSGQYKALDLASKKEEASGELKVIFEDGKLIKDFTLKEIRENVRRTI